jgi:hypothetical protein
MCFIAVMEMEKLDAAELTILDKCICPDCKLGRMLKGPAAWPISTVTSIPNGVNMNIRCDNPQCGHEFNAFMFMGTMRHADRLDRNEPALYREGNYLVPGKWTD